MKIGITAFGGIRGLTPNEQSLSSAGIIDSAILRLLIDEFNAEFYLFGNVQNRTRDFLSDKNDKDYEKYNSKFHILDRVEDEPDDLDLIYVISGSDNLRQSGKAYGVTSNAINWVFRTLKKYLKTPMVYIQTDFAAPFFLPEAYERLIQVMYPSSELFKYRDLNILASGSNPEEEFRKFKWWYNTDFIKITPIQPDLHYIINIYNYNYNYEENSIKNVAFAGKDRLYGSRSMEIREYVMSGVPFTLKGKWKDEYLKDLSSLNENFSFEKRSRDFKGVLDLYNKSGCTIYISSDVYRITNTVTSRMYDSLISKSLMLIDERDYEVLCKQLNIPFDDKYFSLLKVNKDNIKEKFDFFCKEENKHIIDYNRNIILNSYRRNRDIVYNSLILYFKNLIKSKNTIEREDDEILNKILVCLKNHLRNNKRLKNKPEEIQSKINQLLDDSKKTPEEYFDKNPFFSRVHLGVGLDETFGSKDNVWDSPEQREYYRKIFNVLKV